MAYCFPSCLHAGTQCARVIPFHSLISLTSQAVTLEMVTSLKQPTYIRLNTSLSPATTLTNTHLNLVVLKNLSKSQGDFIVRFVPSVVVETEFPKLREGAKYFSELQPHAILKSQVCANKDSLTNCNKYQRNSMSFTHIVRFRLQIQHITLVNYTHPLTG